MDKERLQISLGFTDDTVSEGTHLCLIFSSEEERKESLLKFLLSGLQSGGSSACFSDKIDEKTLTEYFAESNISYDESKSKKAISISGTSEVYFQNGKFDPDLMINNLTEFYDNAIRLGFPTARVIGEMIPAIENVPGGDRLLEYESRVTILQRTVPVTTVCQYDVHAFDGATIMDILKVHPKMIVNGSVIENPFFIQPEEYLNGRLNGN